MEDAFCMERKKSNATRDSYGTVVGSKYPVLGGHSLCLDNLTNDRSISL
jgi:hypothetical protein